MIKHFAAALLLLGIAYLSTDTAQVQTTPCGAPNYSCLSTSLATIPISSLPNVGNLLGAGTTVVDPDFGIKIVRLTDANFEAPQLVNSLFTVAGSGSGDEIHDNCNGDRVLISDGGGRNFPTIFQNSKLQRMYVGSTLPSGLFFTGASFFGFDCPNDGYKAFTWEKTKIGFYDLSNLTVAPSFTSITDVAVPNCLGVGFSPTWSSGGETESSDSYFPIGFSNNGGQAGPGAIYVAVATKTKACRVLNISTSMITGTYGPLGSATTQICSGAKIHNVKSYKNSVNPATIITVDGGTNCPVGGYVWFVNTNTVVPQCTAECGGHFTEGDHTYANVAGNMPPSHAYIATRPNTQTGSVTSVVSSLPTSGYPSGLDWHCGWNFANDAYPFGCTTYNTKGQAISGGWQDEVILIDPSGLRPPIRCCHTFNTGSSQNFSVMIAVGSFSQTGNRFYFTSDWMRTLGSTGGKSVCTPHGFGWTTNTPYTSSTTIYVTPPISLNPGNFTYTATVTGFSGATQPIWPQIPGTSVVDGNITWTASNGPADCRGDVFMAVIGVQSAFSPNPPSNLNAVTQ